MARRSDGYTNKTTARLPSEQELSIRRNYEARSDPNVPRRVASGRGGYAMTADDAIAAASLMDRSQMTSPLFGLPTGGRAFEEAKSYMDDSWDDYYSFDQGGYDYQNLAGRTVTVDGQDYVRPGTAVTSGRAPRKPDPNVPGDRAKTTSRDPAPITIPHTSTSNPERPRTVAAGYDPERQVLTVVFRDGTFYNYYTVGESDWEGFKSIESKGPYIHAFLDGKPRGTARMSNISLASREGLYRIAKTGQWINDGQVTAQIDRSLPARTNPTKQRRKRP